MEVFIFGFNRGLFLQNAVKSVHRHVENANVTIVDDRSTDRQTLSILDDLSKFNTVLTTPENAERNSQTGGLHSAMQFAFKTASSSVVLVLQDDMQIVRDVSTREIASAAEAFDNENASCVLAANFAKTHRGDRNTGLVRNGSIYWRPPEEEVNGRYSAYSAVGLFHLPMLTSLLGTLSSREVDNNRRLLNQSRRLQMMVNPFLHWLPFPITYRSRARTWNVRLIDWLAGSDIHPIEPLAGERLSRFLSRPPDDIPFAEDWLRAPTAPTAKYWSLHGGASNGLARGGWRATLTRRLR